MPGYTLRQKGVSGRAVVLCEGYFGRYPGKTANGLVRRSWALDIVGVVDSIHAGKDAGEVLDGTRNGIPVFGSVEEALRTSPDWLVIGVASIGGRLPGAFRPHVRRALDAGVGILSGLHERLAQDAEFRSISERSGAPIVDIRVPSPLEEMQQFQARTSALRCGRIPVLGTDGSVGKRTTAILLTEALNGVGVRAELVVTGQTGLLQGAGYGLPLDAIPGDYMVGELESEVVRAWEEGHPDIIVIEGQGSISHPAYVCGSRAVICASSPTGIVLQHAPGRTTRNYGRGSLALPMPRVEREIEMLRTFSGSDVVALTINHEGMSREDVERYKAWTRSELGIPSWDVLLEGAHALAEHVVSRG